MTDPASRSTTSTPPITQFSATQPRSCLDLSSFGSCGSCTTPLYGILGAGAVGFAVGSALRSIGANTVILSRSSVYQNIRAEDLRAGDIDHKASSHNPGPSHKPADMIEENSALSEGDLGDDATEVEGWQRRWIWQGQRTQSKQVSHEDVLPHIKMLFITVQTYHLQAALGQIAPYLTRGTVVVSLCNGRCDGILAQFQQQSSALYRGLIVRLGIAFFNSTPIGPRTYRCSKGAYIFWGSLPESSHSTPQSDPHDMTGAEQIIFDLEHDKNPEQLFFRHQNPIAPLYYRKWILNTSSNSLAAARQISHAEDLLGHAEELDRCLQEAYDLAEVQWGKMVFSLGDIRLQLHNFLRLFGSLEISMPRHLRTGAQTESAFLAGCAQEHAPKFPCLRELHNRIMELEKKLSP